MKLAFFCLIIIDTLNLGIWQVVAIVSNVYLHGVFFFFLSSHVLVVYSTYNFYNCNASLIRTDTCQRPIQQTLTYNFYPR